jgi:hypothetical protein
MALYGASDRTKTGAATRVRGRRQKANLQLAFYERRPATLAERWPQIAERMATFRPVGPWMVWLLGLLVVAGVPAAVAVAALQARDADRGDASPGA